MPDFGSSASVSAGAFSPSTRSTARSLRESNDTTIASSPGWRPRTSTRVSSCPATTCAFVTTSPFPATQPEPSTPSPHALPRIFTTLSAAARTPSARAIPAVGGGTRADGASIRGNGSSRASASISPLDGGSHVLSCCRIDGALDLAARLAAVGQRQRAQHPRDPEPDAGGQHRAQHPVRRPSPPAIAPGRAIARPPPRGRSRTPSRRSAHRPGRRPATRASGDPRRAAAGRRACRPRRRSRSRRARVRPRRSPAPSRTGRAAPRRPRSASRCRSRHPSVPASPYSQLVEHDGRPATHAGATRSPTPGASPRSPPRRCWSLGRRDRRRRALRARRSSARSRRSRRPGSAAITARCTRCCPTRRGGARRSTRLQRTYRQAAETITLESRAGRPRQRT